jgi:UDP-2,4-diacetamido-2,4,6-trideoxy-beta-L-altropyranose hydrolase
VILLPHRPIAKSLLDGPLSHIEQQRDLEQVMDRTSSEYSAVIVDHYGLGASWENGIRSPGRRIMAIDDLANREHDVDVLVDQNWYGPDTANRYSGLLPQGCLQLLGPRYAILQSAYAPLRERPVSPARPVRRVLVSFGGSDPTGETTKVLEALARPEFADIIVDVVLGSRSILTQELKDIIACRSHTHLHVGLPTLADLLSKADLAVGASGSGTWERICLGVPAVVTTTTRAHSGVTRALAEAGLTTWAGVGGEVGSDRYADLLRSAIAGDHPSSPPLVDGIGAPRIAEVLFPTQNAAVTLRNAKHSDAPIFLGADPGGPPGEPMQLDGPSAWRQTEAQFHRDLEHPGTILLVVALESIPVGRVRAQLGPGAINISYVLDDAVSGRDLASRVSSAMANSDWVITNRALSWAGTAIEQRSLVTVAKGPLFGSFDIPTGTIAAEDDAR